jgi:hypothetical protein
MANSNIVLATLTPANVLAKLAFDALLTQSTARDGELVTGILIQVK